MAKIVIIKNAQLKQFQGAPGKSLSVDIESHGSDNAEFFQIPGIFSKPQDDIQAVCIDCNGMNIVIAGHDYKYNQDIDKGETLIYSYDASGALKGKLLVDKNGLFKIENDDQSLKTLIDSLIDEIKGIITTGSPTTHTVSAASQAALDLIKADFAELLKA